MSDDKIEFKMLEAKLTGSDTVVFRLEDGARVRIKVDIRRAGVAVNFTNPDGTPHYSVDAGLAIQIIPSNKKFYIPRSKLKVPTARKESTIKPV